MDSLGDRLARARAAVVRNREAVERQLGRLGSGGGQPSLARDLLLQYADTLRIAEERWESLLTEKDSTRPP
jgi:hypothetical protein